MNIRNQETRMTRRVKPQASIPVSTYYQEAFESLFVPSRILEQEKQGIDYQRDKPGAKMDTRGKASYLRYSYQCFYFVL